MQKSLILFVIISVATLFIPKLSQAQTIELLAGNALNGAVQGTLLGGASMALTNSDQFDPLRIGIGLGTLYGIGMGAYDISKGSGHEVLVSALFNDGNNSSVIVLLDTFYGAALGSVVVTAALLVANEPILKGLQYGAGIGAFAGFGFGLFDTFVIAERTYAPRGVVYGTSNSASGLMALNFENGSSLGFINPTVIRTTEISASSFGTNLSSAIEVLNFRLNF